ncbi:4Fe-4S binding protein [Synechococcus sp. CB0101]|uniref:4Fe-4S binding protein n=1 Tax=Synechococcus sp. CB0101 TaxID=232348 RepID=UPI0002002CB9|nr:4Fe-4S binding protein [Synechococcus sp. CB0101]
MPNVSPELLKLAPLLVGRVRRGVVGSSRYARSLRDAVRQVAHENDGRPVLITGEPGLEKDNLAALIHFGSSARKQLMVRLDGALLKPDGSDLFGTGGVLELLGAGSLLIDQLEHVPEALMPRLVQLAKDKTWGEGRKHRCEARLFFTTETAQPEFDSFCTTIRVPPLRVRRGDLGEWLRYGIRQQSRKMGWSTPPDVQDSVIKRLQNYDFPNNLRELEELIHRALQQARCQNQESFPDLLPEDVFWTPARQQRYRFDIWRWKPYLRGLMRAPWLWNSLLFGLVSWVFVLVNVWLWMGPQDRSHNGALNLFWAWWWPLILLSFPLVGRLWCSICPFMVWGEMAQRLSRALGHQPGRWPRGESDTWASPVLAGGFALILLWEEVWNLGNTAWLSSCLLLLITAGAVLGSLRYEKRFWCRYLCPVGGMNGLFAKLSILELRAQVGTCSGSCSSYACFKGGPADGEGLRTNGCPLGTHPAHLNDNRNCVLCLTCAQACPHRSVQLSLRPPAADIQRTMDLPPGEPALLLILAGDLSLHHWQRLLGWLPAAPASLSDGHLLPRLAVASLALALPAGLFGLAGLVVPKQRLLQGLYGLLPLVWALLLARHLPLGMGEAGMLLPVSASAWGPEWSTALPAWSADPHVIAFCQSAVLLVGWLGAVVLLRRQFATQRASWLGSSGLALALAMVGRWLVAI